MVGRYRPWRRVQHILPMYLLLSSLRETDYKNPQKTPHIYISVCHNSLGLGPSSYANPTDSLSSSTSRLVGDRLIRLGVLTTHYAFLSVLRDNKRRRITNFFSTHLCQFKFIKCRGQDSQIQRGYRILTHLIG